MQTQSSSSASGALSPSSPTAPLPSWPARLEGGSARGLSVLVVEDDDPVRHACAGTAEGFGCRVRTAVSVPEARSLLAEAAFDVVFLDVRLPGGSGDLLLRELRSAQPHAFVVVMTAFATVNSAVDLMRSGAGEFLQKPFPLGQITEILEAVTRRREGSGKSRALAEKLASGLAAGGLVGVSEPMQRLFRMVAKVANARHPALILGERGAGKEAIARAIHGNGPHATAPFLPIDCDSLRPDRLEAELFGGVAGPDTQTTATPGLFAMAGEGTVFLSEVGSLDPSLQARLVRALTERQIRPSPTAAPLPLLARVLASSSRDLLHPVEAGRFRKDLYYRLNVVTLRVPPLRERPDDIPLLAELFLQRQRRSHTLPFTLSEEALASMLRYDWAGNVEELEGLIERACGLSSNALLHFGDMSTQVKNFVEALPAPAVDPGNAAADPNPLIPIQELEKRAIQDALKQLNGDKLLVAKCLGIGKTTLYRKLKEYDLIDEKGGPGG